MAMLSVAHATPASATPAWPVTYSVSGTDLPPTANLLPSDFLETDALGNVYSSISVWDGSAALGTTTIDGDGTSDPGGWQMAILSHDSDGILRWVYALPHNFGLVRMVTSPSGRTYALVQDDGSPATTFEGIPTTSGDEVLLALDDDGTTAWGMPVETLAGSVALGADDAVYLTGPGAVLTKYDATGEEVWTAAAGEADTLLVTAVTESAGNVLLNVSYAGEYTNGLTTLPDDGTTTQGAVVALDEGDGSFSWAEDYGAAGVDDGSNTIVGDGTGGAYVLACTCAYPTPPDPWPTMVFGTETVDDPPASGYALAYIDDAGVFQWAMAAPGNTFDAAAGGDLRVVTYVDATVATIGGTTVDPGSDIAYVSMTVDDTGAITFEHELDYAGGITMWAVADGIHYVAYINGSGTIDGEPVTPASSDDVWYGLLP